VKILGLDQGEAGIKAQTKLNSLKRGKEVPGTLLISVNLTLLTITQRFQIDPTIPQGVVYSFCSGRQSAIKKS